ncbi:MAG: glycoside hydrolase family 32 protein [Chitinophagaceae bacterium]|nr:glycoside hydrolase family 32 protein [Chitinophagaceae bacterium]
MISLFFSFLIFISQTGYPQTDREMYSEKHRPQIHFSPQKGWMNDPNGMVYFNGKYHLFFQHNPNSSVWGPMHWGHAISTDLVHWKELPIALYPDALGTIFSGSAVIDKENTAGFGENAMIAIYTNHSHELEKEGFEKIETQGIAYSLDEGTTWTKYKGNPVIANPGIRDFRDPKVFWYQPGNKWIMSLATKDRITFYSSPDLKNWMKESEFGENSGAHGGVWECPDLFPLSYGDETVWVLIVNINPGGPNGGSGTQYFTGSFDGHEFVSNDTLTKWIDYGPDNYAGITWSNTGDRKLFIGWMSNWSYANIVPTTQWRSTNTIVRELDLIKSNNRFFVRSVPVKETDALILKSFSEKNLFTKNASITKKTNKLTGPASLQLTLNNPDDFHITLFNTKDEKLIVGYNKTGNHFYIDRSLSGDTQFSDHFKKKIIASRIASEKNMNLSLLIDETSIEVFADNGLSLMSAIFFPSVPYSDLTISSEKKLRIKDLTLDHLERIWK